MNQYVTGTIIKKLRERNGLFSINVIRGIHDREASFGQ